MATFEEKLQADRDWLKDQIATFGSDVSTKQIVSAQKIGEKNFDFSSMVMGIAFGEDLDGKAINKKYNYSYHQFDIEDDEEKFKAAKERQNLLDLWLSYLQKLISGHEEEQSKVRRQYLRNLLVKETEAFIAKPDKTRSIFMSKIAKGPSGYKAIVKDDDPAIKTMPIANLKTTAGVSNYDSLSVFATSVTGVMFPVVTGALLTGVSKLTICTAMGFAGFPIAGMAAGFVSSVVAAAWKNRKAIGAEMGAQEGALAKVGAWVIGMGKTIHASRNKIIFSTVAGGFGGLATGAVLDLVTANECVADTFRAATDVMGLSDWSGMEDLQSAKETIQSQLSDLQKTNASFNTELEHLTSRTDALEKAVPQMDSNGDTSFTYDDLRREFSGVKQTDVPPALGTGREWPSYISDPKGSFDEFVKKLNDAGNPAEATETPPKPVRIIEAPQPSAAGGLPQNDTVIVKAGDNLTKIVEEQYNIDELSKTDSDKDGIRDFDEIMAAVAKANGLEGDQQNWLKVNWELTMPDVDVANGNADINRPSLDANWRAGDVVYSDVPKMAA